MTVLAGNPPGPDEVRIITIASEDPIQVAQYDVGDTPDDGRTRCWQDPQHRVLIGPADHSNRFCRMALRGYQFPWGQRLGSYPCKLGPVVACFSRPGECAVTSGCVG